MMNVGLVRVVLLFFVCFVWVFFYQVSKLLKYKLEAQLTALKIHC